MSSVRALVFFLAACLSSATRADETPFRAPHATVSLLGGFAARNSSLEPSTAADQRLTTSLGGVSPTVVRLRGEVFPLRWLGAELEAATDVFKNTAKNPVTTVWSARFEARLGVSFRYVHDAGFIVSGSAGYGLSRAPVIRYPVTQPTDGPKDFDALTTHGPAFRLGAGFYRSRFEGTLSVTALLGVLGARLSTVEPQLFVGWRLVDLDTLSLAAGVDYGALIEPSSGGYRGVAHRVSIGVRVSFLPAPPPRASPLDATTTALRVQVQRPDGLPALGASVALDGAAAVGVDDQGARVLTPAPGAHAVTASLVGFRAASASTQVPEGLETVLVVRLEALTGPGQLTGVVQAAATSTPIEGATVKIGTLEVRTAADGSYRFVSVGPGPVQVRVEGQGFNPADEVAQVPPEGAAKLDVSLDALGKGSPATVRGLVRSRTGEPLVATVVIKGLATKVPVTAEGRFVVTVPGGPYLFLISAPGYVPQTKKVVLADGDQAIFHCELQKVSK